MKWMKLVGILLIGLWWCLAPAGSSSAAESGGPGKTHVVTAGMGSQALAEALAAAAPGDTIEVQGGVYPGPVVVEQSVRLVGHDWPVLDGNNQGTILYLKAPDIHVSGFEIRNSGDSLNNENAGIAVEAAGAVVENNRLINTLFGIYMSHASGSIVRGNYIESKEMDIARRGDTIRIWYSNDVLLEDNVVEKGRDVVLWYSERLTVRGNLIREGRYALHFMYCDDALIEDNLLIDNSVGAYLMYGRRMILQHNTISSNRGPSGYGVGLKDMDEAVVTENLFLDNRIGIYLDNSPREIDSTGDVSHNVFAYNDIGVSMMPSVRRNIFENNSFVENNEQVSIAGGGQLVGNTWQNNYWSDYAGFDADGDGQGDIAYRSERLFESMMAERPELRLFLHSPASNAIDFAAKAFPLVRPQLKLSDEQPLMAAHVPAGVPSLPQPTGMGGLGMALALLLLAGSIMALPHLRRHRYSSLRAANRPENNRYIAPPAYGLALDKDKR